MTPLRDEEATLAYKSTCKRLSGNKKVAGQFGQCEQTTSHSEADSESDPDVPEPELEINK